jgi:hypothetical protein
MRFGMAIDDKDNIVVGFGIPVYENNLNNNIFKVYIKNAKTGLWTEKRLGENLGHDNYYPYMIINGVEDIRALPVQDDYRPELTQFDYPCFYQYVRYFENNSHKKVVDYSNLEVAKERPQLMEQLDMHLDGNGDIHIITRAWLDDFPDRYKSTYDYLTGSLDNLKRVDTEFLHKRFNWLRFFEYKGKMYMAGSTHEKLLLLILKTGKPGGLILNQKTFVVHIYLPIQKEVVLIPINTWIYTLCLQIKVHIITMLYISELIYQKTFKDHPYASNTTFHFT